MPLSPPRRTVKFRLRMLTLFVACIVMPLAAATAFAVYVIHDQQETANTQRVTQTARTTQLVLADTHADSRDAAQAVSGDRRLQAAIASGSAATARDRANELVRAGLAQRIRVSFDGTVIDAGARDALTPARVNVNGARDARIEVSDARSRTLTDRMASIGARATITAGRPGAAAAAPHPLPGGRTAVAFAAPGFDGPVTVTVSQRLSETPAPYGLIALASLVFLAAAALFAFRVSRALREEVAGIQRAAGGHQSGDLSDLASELLSASHAAATDALTGLPNKRSFEAELDEELRRSARYGTPTALVMLDVDHFKSVNDTWGHPQGDHVLRELAATIRGCLRDTDMPARLGGEELAVLARNTTEQGAAELAERIRARIERTPLGILGSDRTHTVTISAGVACAHGGTADELVDRTDRALYTAKRTGRNRVIADQPELALLAGA